MNSISKRNARIITIALTLVITVAFLFDALRNADSQPQSILLRFFVITIALISAITNAEQFISLGYTVIRFFTNRARQIPLAELRKTILDQQERVWIDNILKRTIENEPVRVPFTVLDDGFKDYIRERIAQRQPRQNTQNTDTPRRWRLLAPFQPSIEQEPQIDLDRLSVREVFEFSRRHLIITGEGGAGKTIVLLKLMRDLHAEATNDPSKKIPVVFNLGSWVDWLALYGDMPLEEWFVSEIADIFPEGVQNRQLTQLVRSRLIIFMIDGLDEVPEKARRSFIEKFREFAEQEDAEPTQYVICSRPDAYHALLDDSEFALSAREIRLRRVEQSEILNYLSDDSYFDIRRFILSNDGAKLLPVNRPFVLNAIAAGYRYPLDKDLERLQTELTAGDDVIVDEELEPVPRLVIRRFILQQFAQVDRATNDYATYNTEGKINQYLAWIAAQLQQVSKNEDEENSRTEFMVENLQPAWLRHDGWRWAYSIISRMFGTVAILMAIGFLLSSPLDYIYAGIIAGVWMGILDGALNYGPLRHLKSLPGSRYKMLLPVLMYFSTAFVLSVPLGVFTPSPEGDRILGGVISLTGLTMAWFFPLFISFIYTTRDIRLTLQSDISPVELLRFEIRAFLRFGAVGGVVVGTVVALFAQFLFQSEGGSSTLWLQGAIDRIQSPLVNAFTIGLMVGFVAGGIIAGLLGILSIVNVDERLRPNQGIWMSLRNGLRLSLILTLVVGVPLGIWLAYYYNDVAGFVRGLKNGLLLGAVGGLWYGGIDAIHHAVLRFLLYVSGATPWNFARFLRYASACNLVREIGASYIFGHEYLRLYYLEAKQEKQRTRVAPMVTGAIVFALVMGAIVVRPAAIAATLPMTDDGTFMVTGRTIEDTITTTSVTGLPVCVQEGDEVTVYSRGNIRTGNFLGYLYPEGTEVSLMGLPIGDSYDIIERLPNNALICRVDTQRVWQTCAERPAWYANILSTRQVTFTSPVEGCMEFHINEVEAEKRTGAYYVHVVVNRTVR